MATDFKRHKWSTHLLHLSNVDPTLLFPNICRVSIRFVCSLRSGSPTALQLCIMSGCGSVRSIKKLIFQFKAEHKPLGHYLSTGAESATVTKDDDRRVRESRGTSGVRPRLHLHGRSCLRHEAAQSRVSWIAHCIRVLLCTMVLSFTEVRRRAWAEHVPRLCTFFCLL